MNKPEIKRILVVDDDQVVADTFAEILRKSGYEVVVHYDGDNALQKCNGWVPDLLFSDVTMPKVDGITLATQIRQRYPACRILLCSGIETNRELIQKSLLDGHNFEFVRKPVDPRDLLLKIAA